MPNKKDPQYLRTFVASDYKQDENGRYLIPTPEQRLDGALARVKAVDEEGALTAGCRMCGHPFGQYSEVAFVWMCEMCRGTNYQAGRTVTVALYVYDAGAVRPTEPRQMLNADYAMVADNVAVQWDQGGRLNAAYRRLLADLDEAHPEDEGDDDPR